MSVNLDLSPVNVPKAADVLSGILREKILTGKLAPGQPLPNERDLGTQAGLSRASVREALRILEGEGLIATRTGRNGGSEVLRPSSASIEKSVDIFIRGQHIRLEAVLEARAALEPPSARFAALHRSDDDLAALEQIHARLEQTSANDDIPGFLRANLDWHVQVVRASGNELLIAFITAMSQSVHENTDLEGFNATQSRKEVAQAHRKVMDAIVARDGDAAARRMGRHVGAYIDAVAKTQTKQAAQAAKES